MEQVKLMNTNNMLEEHVADVCALFKEYLNKETQRLTPEEFFKFVERIPELVLARAEVMQLLCVIGSLYNVSEKQFLKFTQTERIEEMKL